MANNMFAVAGDGQTSRQQKQKVRAILYINFFMRRTVSRDVLRECHEKIYLHLFYLSQSGGSFLCSELLSPRAAPPSLPFIWTAPRISGAQPGKAIFSNPNNYLKKKQEFRSLSFNHYSSTGHTCLCLPVPALASGQ
jgi:hypothetical protein